MKKNQFFSHPWASRRRTPHCELDGGDDVASARRRPVLAAGGRTEAALRRLAEVVVTPGIFVSRVVAVADPAHESVLVADGVSYP